MKSSFVLHLLVGVAACMVAASALLAHDTGFGHSRRALFISFAAGAWQLEYRTTLAAEEALVELTLIDRNGDGQVTATEREEYFHARGRQLAQEIKCRGADGQPLPVKLESFALGNSLTQTFRLSIATRAQAFELVDENYPHRPGMVRVLSTPDVRVEWSEPVDPTHAERTALRVRRLGQ